MKVYKDNSFESALARDKKADLTLENKLIHIKSGIGIPVYNSYFSDLEKHILTKVSYFNNNLRKNFTVNGSRSSTLLDPGNKVIQHYTERFPEHQFKVSPGGLFLKPACCATAFNIWSSKKTSLRKKQIIHQVSDCYRVQNTGTTRALSRNCYFTMPDYHMITITQEVLDDFKIIKDYIFELYGSIFSDTWKENYYQVVRVDSDSRIKYSKFIEELDTSPLETIVEQVDWGDIKPYFELKYELSYKNGPKLITLGTIQIDYVYPKLFNLDTTQFGARPCLHFSPGSIGRIIEVLIRQDYVPQKGVAILTIGPEAKDLIDKLKLKCAILVDDVNTLVSRAIPCSYYQKIFFPKLVIIGSKELETNTISVIDRISKKNTKYSKQQFIESINNDLLLMESKEIHYKSTFCA